MTFSNVCCFFFKNFNFYFNLFLVERGSTLFKWSFMWLWFYGCIVRCLIPINYEFWFLEVLLLYTYTLYINKISGRHWIWGRHCYFVLRHKFDIISWIKINGSYEPHFKHWNKLYINPISRRHWIWGRHCYFVSRHKFNIFSWIKINESCEPHSKHWNKLLSQVPLNRYNKESHTLFLRFTLYSSINTMLAQNCLFRLMATKQTFLAKFFQFFV